MNLRNSVRLALLCVAVFCGGLTFARRESFEEQKRDITRQIIEQWKRQQLLKQQQQTARARSRLHIPTPKFRPENLRAKLQTAKKSKTHNVLNLKLAKLKNGHLGTSSIDKVSSGKRLAVEHIRLQQVYHPKKLQVGKTQHRNRLSSPSIGNEVTSSQQAAPYIAIDPNEETRDNVNTPPPSNSYANYNQYPGSSYNNYQQSYQPQAWTEQQMASRDETPVATQPVQAYTQPPAPAPAPAAAAPAPVAAPVAAPAPAPAAATQQRSDQAPVEQQYLEIPGPDGRPQKVTVQSQQWTTELVPNGKGGFTVNVIDPNKKTQKQKNTAQAAPAQAPPEQYAAPNPNVAAAAPAPAPAPANNNNNIGNNDNNANTENNQREDVPSINAAQNYNNYASDGNQNSNAMQEENLANKRVYSLGDHVFADVGCYADNWKRAIPTIEGNHPLLMDPDYKNRKDALQKCAEAALDKGFRVFAIQNGGQCFAGMKGDKRYNIYGHSHKCRDDGLGGTYANEVYIFEEEPKAKAEVAFTKPKIDVKHLMAKCRDEQCADNELADSTDDVDNSLLKEEKELNEEEEEEAEIAGDDSTKLHKPTKFGTLLKHLLHKENRDRTHLQHLIEKENKDKEQLQMAAQAAAQHIINSIKSNSGTTQNTQSSAQQNPKGDQNAQTDPKVEGESVKAMAKIKNDSLDVTNAENLPDIHHHHAKIKSKNDTLTDSDAHRVHNETADTDIHHDDTEFSDTETPHQAKDAHAGSSEIEETGEEVLKGLGLKKKKKKAFPLGAAIIRGKKPPCICPDKVCSSKLDLAFVIDASPGSQVGGREKMAEITEFARRVASAFRIAPSESHLGLITYSTDAQIMLNFKRNSDLESLSDAKDAIRVKPHSGKFTGQALRLAKDGLFLPAHRNDALDVLVIITDGPSNDNVMGPARSLRDMGVKLISVGLGEHLNKRQLANIASDPDQENMFLADFDSLEPLIRKVQKAACVGGVLRDPTTPCRCEDRAAPVDPETDTETAAFLSLLVPGFPENIAESFTTETERHADIPTVSPADRERLASYLLKRGGISGGQARHLPFNNPHPEDFDSPSSAQFTSQLSYRPYDAASNSYPGLNGRYVNEYEESTANSKNKQLEGSPQSVNYMQTDEPEYTSEYDKSKENSVKNHQNGHFAKFEEGKGQNNVNKFQNYNAGSKFEGQENQDQDKIEYKLTGNFKFEKNDENGQKEGSSKGNNVKLESENRKQQNNLKESNNDKYVDTQNNASNYSQDKTEEYKGQNGEANNIAQGNAQVNNLIKNNENNKGSDDKANQDGNKPNGNSGSQQFQYGYKQNFSQNNVNANNNNNQQANLGNNGNDSDMEYSNKPVKEQQSQSELATTNNQLQTNQKGSEGKPSIVPEDVNKVLNSNKVEKESQKEPEKQSDNKPENQQKQKQEQEEKQQQFKESQGQQDGTEKQQQFNDSQGQQDGKEKQQQLKEERKEDKEEKEKQQDEQESKQKGENQQNLQNFQQQQPNTFQNNQGNGNGNGNGNMQRYQGQNLQQQNQYGSKVGNFDPDGPQQTSMYWPDENLYQNRHETNQATNFDEWDPKYKWDNEMSVNNKGKEKFEATLYKDKNEKVLDRVDFDSNYANHQKFKGDFFQTAVDDKSQNSKPSNLVSNKNGNPDNEDTEQKSEGNGQNDVEAQENAKTNNGRFSTNKNSWYSDEQQSNNNSSKVNNDNNEPQTGETDRSSKYQNENKFQEAYRQTGERGRQSSEKSQNNKVEDQEKSREESRQHDDSQKQNFGKQENKSDKEDQRNNDRFQDESKDQAANIQNTEKEKQDTDRESKETNENKFENKKQEQKESDRNKAPEEDKKFEDNQPDNQKIKKLGNDDARPVHDNLTSTAPDESENKKISYEKRPDESSKTTDNAQYAANGKIGDEGDERVNEELNKEESRKNKEEEEKQKEKSAKVSEENSRQDYNEQPRKDSNEDDNRSSDKSRNEDEKSSSEHPETVKTQQETSNERTDDTKGQEQSSLDDKEQRNGPVSGESRPQGYENRKNDQETERQERERGGKKERGKEARSEETIEKDSDSEKDRNAEGENKVERFDSQWNSKDSKEETERNYGDKNNFKDNEQKERKETQSEKSQKDFDDDKSERKEEREQKFETEKQNDRAEKEEKFQSYRPSKNEKEKENEREKERVDEREKERVDEKDNAKVEENSHGPEQDEKDNAKVEENSHGPEQEEKFETNEKERDAQREDNKKLQKNDQDMQKENQGKDSKEKDDRDRENRKEFNDPKNKENESGRNDEDKNKEKQSVEKETKNNEDIDKYKEENNEAKQESEKEDAGNSSVDETKHRYETINDIVKYPKKQKHHKDETHEGEEPKYNPERVSEQESQKSQSNGKEAEEQSHDGDVRLSGNDKADHSSQIVDDWRKNEDHQPEQYKGKQGDTPHLSRFHSHREDINDGYEELRKTTRKHEDDNENEHERYKDKKEYSNQDGEEALFDKDDRNRKYNEDEDKPDGKQREQGPKGPSLWHHEQAKMKQNQREGNQRDEENPLKPSDIKKLIKQYDDRKFPTKRPQQKPPSQDETKKPQNFNPPPNLNKAPAPAPAPASAPASAPAPEPEPAPQPAPTQKQASKPENTQPTKQDNKDEPTAKQQMDPEALSLMHEAEQTSQEMEGEMQSNDMDTSQNDMDYETEDIDAESGGMRHHISRKAEPESDSPVVSEKSQLVSKPRMHATETAEDDDDLDTRGKIQKSSKRNPIRLDGVNRKENEEKNKGILMGDPFLDASHYWPFETEHGPLSPDIVTGHNAVLMNGSHLTGIKSRGVSADTEAPGSFIILGDFNNTCFSDPGKCILGGLTLSFWFNIDLNSISGDADAYIISGGGQSKKSRGFAFLYFHGSYVFVLSTEHEQWKMMIPKNKIPTKTWCNVAFVWDKHDGLTFYEDGNKILTAKGYKVHRPTDKYPLITISRPNNANNQECMFPLKIDSVAMWDRPLKPGQVKQISKAVRDIRNSKKKFTKKHTINRPRTRLRKSQIRQLIDVLK